MFVYICNGFTALELLHTINMDPLVVVSPLLALLIMN